MEKLKAIKILEDLINTPKVEINEDTIKGLLLLTSNYSYFQMDMLKDALAELEGLETKDRQESIFYLVKKIFDDKEKITDIKPLVFERVYEKDFWEKCYIAALESNKYANTPKSIADNAILELRARIQEDEQRD